MIGIVLASQPTISRLENQVTEEDISRLQEAFLETFIRSAPIPPAELTLDIDAWDDPTHGNRGDGAFPLPFNLEACEALPIDYVLGLAGNARLRGAGAALLEEARRCAVETGCKVRLFDELFYAAKSWKSKRRVIIKAEWLAEGPNLRFLVTTRREDPQSLYDRIDVQRGEDCENRIKELKRGLSS